MSQALEGKPEAHPGKDLGNDNGQENGSGTGEREETMITAVTINTEADCMVFQQAYWSTLVPQQRSYRRSGGTGLDARHH